MTNFFPVNNFYTRKRHIIIITLATIIITCIIVFYPCTSEASLLTLGQKKFKFFDGGLEFGKFRTENWVDLHFILRPIYGVGIETFEFSKNLASKYGSSSAKGFIPIHGKANQYQNEGTANSKKPEVSGRQVESENVHPSVFLIMLTGIVLFGSSFIPCTTRRQQLIYVVPKFRITQEIEVNFYNKKELNSIIILESMPKICLLLKR